MRREVLETERCFGVVFWALPRHPTFNWLRYTDLMIVGVGLSAVATRLSDDNRNVR
jgi:hypothetical protein